VYLSESVQPVTSNPVRRHLRSASSLDFIVPRTRTKFGDRAFSIASWTVWDSLPEPVRLAETLASFKRKLKTYLFNVSFQSAFIIYQHCNAWLFWFCRRLGTKLPTYCIVLYCSVTTLETHHYSAGQQITMKLMKKQRGSLQVLPAAAAADFTDSAPFPPSMTGQLVIIHHQRLSVDYIKEDFS